MGPGRDNPVYHRALAPPENPAGRAGFRSALWNFDAANAVSQDMDSPYVPAAVGARGPTAFRQLTVLHAVRTTDPAGGGFVTYLASLRQGLAGRSVAIRTEGVFPHHRHWRVVALRRPLRFLARVKRQLGGVDVLHVHGVFGWHALLSVRAAVAAARPYVVTVHGHLHDDALRERRTSKRLYLAIAGRAMLEHASAVLVTTPLERNIVRRRAPRARIEEVTPGLAVPAAPFSEAAASEGPAAHPLRVLYLGRLHPHKGLHLVVRALGEACNEAPDAELTIAGTGRPGYQRRVARLAARMGLADRVRFLGHVDAERKSSLFRKADVFVLPSRSENFGFAPAEAMAAGIPVVLSENVGLADLVARRQCGRVVPVGDVDALRLALWSYVDPAVRREHGRRAHAAAREAFSFERMGAALETLYRDIVHSAGQS